MLSRDGIDQVWDQPLVIGHVPFEPPDGPGDEGRMIGAEHGIGALDTGNGAQHVNRVTLIGIIIEHTVRGGIQIRRQGVDLVAQQLQVPVFLQQVGLRGDRGDDEGPKEDILPMHVVRAPMGLDPGVVNRVQHQVDTGLDRIARIHRRRRVCAVGIGFPGGLQVFGGPQVIDGAEDGPLGAGDVIQVEVAGLARGHPVAGIGAVARCQVAVQRPGQLRDFAFADRGIGQMPRDQHPRQDEEEERQSDRDGEIDAPAETYAARGEGAGAGCGAGGCGFRREAVCNHGALQAEGQVAGVTQQRHFKDMKALYVRDPIDPFCQATPIPELPEEPADQGGERQEADAPPVAVAKRCEDRGLAAPGAQRGEQHEGGDPEQGKEQVGPDAHGQQAGRRRDPAGCSPGAGPGQPQLPEIFQTAGERRHGGQEICRPQDGRQHR